MKIKTLSDIVLKNIKRYDDIDSHVYRSGNFALSAKDGDWRIYFESTKPYNYAFTQTSGLFKRRFFETSRVSGTGAFLQLRDEFNYLKSMIYDKESGIFHVEDSECSFGFAVVLTDFYGSIQSDTAVLSDNESKKLMKQYKQLFDQVLWRLNVREYQAQAAKGAYKMNPLL